MNKKRCVIVGGAEIKDIDYIKTLIKPDDFVVYCDSGLRHMESLGAEADLIVGDFDSHENPKSSVETIVLPREKDDTDTFFAAKEAVRRGFDDFLLLGVIGGRLDHTLANVSILLWLESIGKSALVADDHSSIRVISAGTTKVDAGCEYFSLLNITGDAKGVTIKNAKFPLENAEIPCEYQFAVSNEPIGGSQPEISLGRGRLLLVEVRHG